MPCNPCRCLTVVLALALGATLSTAHAEPPVAAEGGGRSPDEAPRTIIVPLQDGVLDVDQVLDRLLRQAGLGSAAATGWRIDLNDPDTVERLAAVRESTGGMLSLERRDRALVVSFDPKPAVAAVGSIEQRLRAGIRSAMGPRLASASSPVYGIRFYTPQAPHLIVEELPAVPRRAVVLVHGFDDPGWTWSDLLPVLYSRGHAVARFDYPNDGPIPDAADRLGAELLVLKAAGVERVDLVTHSMGGLVAREILTRPEWYDGDARGDGRLPAIERLVMLGPPNHGSEMARLAPLSEVKDQLVRWLVGPGGFGARPADGNGEAAVQLLPGSRFLSELNARPLPTHVQMTIVAGRLAPPAEGVSAWIDRAKQAMANQAPKRAARLDRAAERLKATVESTMAAIGDGLVTISSTQLEGVDDVVIVEGDHLGMVARWKVPSPQPPAIPVVVERLERAVPEGATGRP